jgi:hypothetical protein
MSVGGLWPVELKRGPGGVTAGAATLCGVLFYQWRNAAKGFSVRAHGRRSVYDVAYRAIAGAPSP